MRENKWGAAVCLCVFVITETFGCFGEDAGAVVAKVYRKTCESNANVDLVQSVESLNIDPTIEFDFEEMSFGPARINFPIPRGASYTGKWTNYGSQKIFVLRVRNEAPLFSIYCNVDIIESNGAIIYNATYSNC